MACGGMQEAWLQRVGPFIQARIERYAASEIRFNLMAVIRDRRDALSEELSGLEARRDARQASCSEGAPSSWRCCPRHASGWGVPCWVLHAAADPFQSRCRSEQAPEHDSGAVCMHRQQ